MSAWGFITMGRSARSKLRWRKVESTATSVPGSDSRRSVTRVHRIGCISAMLEPQSTKASACSMSLYTPMGSSEPKVRIKPPTAEAMQWRALGSMLLLRKPALNSLLAA